MQGARGWRRLGCALAIAAVAAAGTPTPPAGARSGAAGLSLSLERRWGTATPGEWAPYVVTVRNEGPETVRGSLRLVPAGRDVPVPVGERPPVPPIVLGRSIGSYEMGVPPGPGPVMAPERFPTYRIPLVLAAGAGEKVVEVVVPEAPHGYRAELHGPGRGPLAVAEPPPPRDAGPRHRVALLAGRLPPGAGPGALDEHFGTVVALTLVPGPRDLPAEPLALRSLDAVVVADFDTAALGPAQQDALRTFVAQGGSLVVLGGAGAMPAVRGLPQDLVPFHPTGVRELTLAGLAGLAGADPGPPVRVLTGEVRSGRVALASGPDPLVVEAGYGGGRVVQLAYDPLAGPGPADPVLRNLGWGQGIGRALARWGSAVEPRTPVPFPGASVAAEQLWAPVLDPPRPPRWPPGRLVAVAAGAAAAVAGASVALRRRTWRRAAAGLVASAAGAAVVLGATAGSAWEPSAGRAAVTVTNLGPEGTALTTTFTGEPGGRSRRVSLPAAARASTVFVGAGRWTDAGVQADMVGRGSGGGLVEVGPAGTDVHLPAEGQTRTYQVVVAGPEGDLDARLRVVAAPGETATVRLAGTVTNRTPRPLADLRAQLPHGAQARLAARLAPGETVEVDAPFVRSLLTPVGSRPPAPAPDRVGFAAARQAFTRSGQVVLVAHVAGRSPRPGPELALVTRAVTVESVDGGVDQEVHPVVGTASVVATSYAGPPEAWVNVYELGGVALGAGPAPELVSGASMPLEIFDWGAGTWRRAPGVEERRGYVGVRLEPGEIRDGVVRIRDRANRPQSGYYSLRTPSAERR